VLDSWQVTAVAVCEGCAGGGKDLISVIDFGLDIVKASSFNNWQPPFAWYGDISLKGRAPPPGTLTGITPMSTFENAQYPMLQIQCGRTFFNMPTPLIAGSSLWDRDYLRIAYTDDFNAAKAVCGQGLAQSIDRIWQMNDLPKGVKFSKMTKIETEQDAAAAYFDLTWRPQCEDFSQVGDFLFCFQAADHLRREPFDAFAELISYPGLSNTRSCLAVSSLPLAPNPSPELVPPTILRRCSQECCDCCGRPGCACQSTTTCCAAMYATAGDTLVCVI
jgi:hypothetical protein